MSSALCASAVNVADSRDAHLRKGQHRNGRRVRRRMVRVVHLLVSLSLVRVVCSSVRSVLGRARVRVHKLGRDVDGEGADALPQAGDEVPRAPLQNGMRTPGILSSKHHPNGAVCSRRPNPKRNPRRMQISRAREISVAQRRRK